MAFLVALGICAERTRPYPSLAEILASPEKYDGALIGLTIECKVEEVRAGGFILRQMGARMFVRTPEEDVRSGQDVAVEGIYHAPGTVVVTRMRVARERRLKMAISVVPVIVVVVLGWRSVGFERRGGWLSLRKSGHA
jgi:hypothetical protein